MQVIAKADALEKSIFRAQQCAAAAIAALQPVPDSQYKQALESIARYSVERTH